MTGTLLLLHYLERNCSFVWTRMRMRIHIYVYILELENCECKQNECFKNSLVQSILSMKSMNKDSIKMQNELELRMPKELIPESSLQFCESTAHPVESLRSRER